MASVLNQGLNCATTADWLNAIKDMKLTAYYPSSEASQLNLTRQPAGSMRVLEGKKELSITFKNVTAVDK